LRLGTVPPVPGAERAASDVKLGTFAEVAAILVVVPLFGFLFGVILPKTLSRRCHSGSLSFEWAAAGMASSLVLWRLNVRPIVAVPVAAAAAALAAAFVVEFRTSFGLRRTFAASNRRHLLAPAGAGATWELARTSGIGRATPLLRDPILDVLAAAAFALGLSYLLARARGRASAEIGHAAPFSWLCVSLCAVAIAFPKASAPLLVLSAAVLLVGPWIGRAASRTALPAALLILLACGWTIYYQPYGPVNLFEDGHALAFADAYLSGAAPFRDTYPVHGWGLDGGVDALFFRIFGATLETFRTRVAVFTALEFGALAIACAVVMGNAGWGIAAFLISLAICPFVSERTLFAWVAIAFLTAGVRRSKRKWIVLGGVFSAVEVFFSFDMGMILLVGGTAGLACVAIASRERRQPAAYLAGAAAGSVPFVAVLASTRSVGSFVHESFAELPKEIVGSWGLPARPLLANPPTLAGVLAAIRGAPVTPAFLVVAVTLCATVALFRIPWNRDDLAIVPLVAIAAVSLRGVFGRADVGHAVLYGAYVGIPATWLLRRGVSKSWIGGSVVLAFLGFGLRPVAALRAEVSAITNAASARAIAGVSMRALPRGGSARVPREQADDLAALRRTIDGAIGPSETFFDFSNEPALYFLLGRRMPMPYLGPEFYETEGAQRRIVALCEREEPPLAIARAGNGLDSLDGIANEIRAPIVAKYLAEHYRPFAIVAGRTILRRIPGG
jgi:hypothetical protein